MALCRSPSAGIGRQWEGDGHAVPGMMEAGNQPLGIMGLLVWCRISLFNQWPGEVHPRTVNGQDPVSLPHGTIAPVPGHDLVDPAKEVGINPLAGLGNGWPGHRLGLGQGNAGPAALFPQFGEDNVMAPGPGGRHQAEDKLN